MPKIGKINVDPWQVEILKDIFCGPFGVPAITAFQCDKMRLEKKRNPATLMISNFRFPVSPFRLLLVLPDYLVKLVTVLKNKTGKCRETDGFTCDVPASWLGGI
jgi:hypothetical protein